AGMNVSLTLPFERGLLRFVHEALAQCVELKSHVAAEQRLRIRQDCAVRIDTAGQRQRANCDRGRADTQSAHSAASLPCPRRLLRVLSSFSAASAITVPGGKIASVPACISAS